jgi:MarR family transcriptional regulator, temperature-dependent positive regulator of motility
LEKAVALLDMAGHLIRRLNQISTTVFHQRIQQAGYDLTPVQFAAMQALRSHPDIEQAQVAALIAYDRATIGGVIDRLEQKGYVSRVVSKQDRRARQCRLTSQGNTVIETIIPVVESLQQEILDGLNAKERQQFIALAQKAVTHDQEKKAQ